MLAELIDHPERAIGSIASYLDHLDGAARWAEVGALSRKRQRVLFEKAAQAAPIDFAHFTGNAAPLVEVIHDGKNTLPLPDKLKGFQKRFCRPDDGSARLFGYNEGPTRKLVGPGYFVVIPTHGRPQWEVRGAIVVDYFQVPDGAVVAGWPRVVPNSHRLSRLVYHQTRDFMRRVSSHVSIGAAYKHEHALDHYFVLCRR